MQIKNFEDLEIWKESRRLTRDVYDLSKASTFFKDFGLGDQMRRAAVSIMSNIAEEFERGAPIGDRALRLIVDHTACLELP